jgi:chromosome segregation ATPase
MFKKIGITALVLVVAVALLGQTRAGKYLWSWVPVGWESVSTAFKGLPSPEMEIKRIKSEINNLNNDILRNFSAVARAEVDLDAFKEEVATAQANLDARLKNLKVLDKQADDATFTRNWETYKIAEATLASKKKLLEHKQEMLRVAQDKLTAMRDQRDQLKTRVADLETKLEEVRLAQTQCPVQVDDSRLGEVKTAINELDKRIKVMKKEVEYKANFGDDEQPVSRTEVQVKGKQAREEFRSRFADDKPAVVEK